ncbi:MAG TPA: hypothetical protein VK843_13545 [Planctomycetota bacterium]|nr:hypothetical protein [Planctomycetota bacterium]
MIKPILLTCAALFAAGTQLATDYSADKGFKVEFESSLSMKTTSSSMERDGEPVEGRGMGGGASSQSRKAVYVDKIVAAKDGKPSKVTRAFETLAGSSTTTRGEEERTTDLDPPLAGVTLSLERAENGDVTAKVVDGKAPSDDAALEGHHMELALDALLPDGEVADGASWEPNKDAVRRALMLDMEKALFPRPAPPEGEAGGGGGGGGRRGGFGGGGGDGRLLDMAEWEAKATLTEEKAEKDGVACRVIAIELKAKGDMPDPPMGGRRGQMFGNESDSAVFGNTYKIELEGKLYFSTAEKRPVALEVEGSMSQETDREFEREGSTTRMRSTREGTYKQTVAISRP